MEQARAARSVQADSTGPEAVRRQTDKILASPGFQGSERMSRFLRFAVERTLAGTGSELKEYLLGLEIFDRNESYDPRVDPIVRVEARRLRSKLKTYYENEGRTDALVIELPTGTYVPRFRARIGEKDGAAPARNIAVLPFTNLSTDPESEYFSDGLTEELIHALTKVDGLRVVAWNTAAKLKDRQSDIGSIGRQLNVASVLMGSVRSAGGRLRVMARLIDTATGYYLWSETFDRQLEDLFAIQEGISRAIVDTLRIKLTGAKAAHGIARSPSNLEAYNLYLKGRFHWNQRTRDSLERAIQCFREAVAIDPSFASGYAGLADAYTLLAEHGMMEPLQIMGEAKAAAEKALELHPGLAEAHTSIALIQSLYERQWAEAGEHYRRAIELNPSYATAHHWYGTDYLALLGRLDEAEAEMALAVTLDPLAPVMYESYAYVFMLRREFEKSLEQSCKAAELDPYYYRAHTGRGRTLIQMGRYSEAIEMLEKGRSLVGDMPSILGALGQAYGLAGNQTKARGVLQDLTALRDRLFAPSTAFALVHLGLKDPDRALDWLEQGCDRHELSLTAIKVHPAYDALRGEPRFNALLARLGL